MLTCRSFPRPTRSTAVFVRPGLEPMAAQPHCRKSHAPGYRQRPGTRANAHRTASIDRQCISAGNVTRGTCVCSRYARTRKARLCDSLMWATCSFVRSPPSTAKSQNHWNGPVELECLARAKRQWHKGAASRRLLLSLPIGPPVTRKSRDPAIGPVKPEHHQIGMQLLACSPLLARLGRLRLQPAGKLLGERIKFALPIRRHELRLDCVRVQILLDGVARHSRPPRDLAERQLLSQSHTSDDVQ